MIPPIPMVKVGKHYINLALVSNVYIHGVIKDEFLVDVGFSAGTPEDEKTVRLKGYYAQSFLDYIDQFAIVLPYGDDATGSAR